jgi:uncharacterized membrane protein YqaE (UPF0057 family)
MTTEQIIAFVMPIVGVGMAIGVGYWQSWRDGVLPNQKLPDKKK